MSAELIDTYTLLPELDGPRAMPDVHQGAGRGHEEDVTALAVSLSSRSHASGHTVPVFIRNLECDGHLDRVAKSCWYDLEERRSGFKRARLVDEELRS